ncbi:DUF2255 family protein [Algoriphagus sp. H41]|uniref:DUF2255 family protein n=1 Tax=Algoriphagus oliviformis TaxID=2811231 RepID=A0ABS3C4J2_9BACT|nr:DUF2255 family protein [Algoriphagus oliviformis]MBN7811862.1 DUF2255 family protein [Algoriphagus oliviformis]
MNQLSETLSSDEIRTIASKDDFHIAALREDGITYGPLTWIWSVSVDDQLFVRAYHGTSSRWFKSAMNQGMGKISAAGMDKKVKFKSVQGEINEKIDQAYRKKYAESPYLNSMISARARSATVQILPWQ